MTTTPTGRPLALVTGASAGIGYQFALLFAQHGYDLVATGRSDAIAQAAKDFEKHGARVVPVQADLAQYGGVEAVWQAAQNTSRPIAAAVLNAGRSIGGAFLDTDLDDELGMIALNVTSVVHLAKPVARHMAANRAGKILITSSLSAMLPTPYETVYGPTRAFARMFALGLREELKEHGVSVTCLLPGATDSNFHARAGMGSTAFGDGMKKNSRILVAQMGYDAMMTGKAEVVGGDRATQRAYWRHWILPETVKAERHARMAKPRP